MSIGARTRYDLQRLFDEIEREQEQIRRVSLGYEKPHRRPVPARIAVLIYAIGLACLIALVMLP